MVVTAMILLRECIVNWKSEITARNPCVRTQLRWYISIACGGGGITMLLHKPSLNSRERRGIDRIFGSFVDIHPDHYLRTKMKWMAAATTERGNH